MVPQGGALGKPGISEQRRGRRGEQAAPSTAEELLAALDDCGRAALDERTYFRDALGVLLHAGLYTAVRVWIVDGKDARCQAGAPESGSTSIPPIDVLSRAAAEQGSELLSLPAASGESIPTAIAGYRMLDSEGVVLEAPLKAGAVPSFARRLLEAAAETISHVCVRMRYRDLRVQGDAASAVNGLLSRFYGAESLTDAAFGVAEGLQEELGYDRAWVLSVSRRDCQVIATSAAVEVSRRRRLTRLVERAAAAVLRTGRDVAWTAGADPSALRAQLVPLADEAGARRLRILLLSVRQALPPVVGVVVLEAFSADARDDEDQRLQTLRPHASLAIWQALRVRRSGLRGLWFRMTQSWRWIKYAAAAAAIVVGAAWLGAPTDFEVEVEGRLMPVARRSVYAPADGVVMSLDARHDEPVAEGAQLLTLRDPKLDLEEERLSGQIEELRSRLAALEVLRTQGRRSTSDSPIDFSAQAEQLNVAIAGAGRQLELVRRQQDRMKIASPIAGIVDRWDLREALTARPVVRGQFLVDVLDTAGPWELELLVPDRLAAPMLEARSRNPDLPVRYVIRTDAGTEHATRITTFGDRVEIDERGRPVIRAKAVLEEPPQARRAGASAIARIECGRTSRAYAWFHELWDYVQREWLL